MEKKGTPASPATARASRVLPEPGGPTKRTPFGMRAPSRLYSFGFLRKRTISASSSLASSTPATSLKVVLVSVSTKILALLRPIDIRPPKPCRSARRRNQKIQMPKNSSIGTTQDNSVERNVLWTSPENFT